MTSQMYKLLILLTELLTLFAGVRKDIQVILQTVLQGDLTLVDHKDY